MTGTQQRLTTTLADRYSIARELGAGGMATVYLAHDVKHDRDVAIKVLHPDLGAALGGERFLAEIKTTAKLQHPHILPLLDSGDADGLLYYVMPFVSGETLRSRLDREHLLPIDDALRIGRELADALEYAHGLGVIHRDIKPENILLQNGHALVADFGIALAVQQAGGARMTQTGLSLGTPQYMSPEQAMGERTIDARSDQYALAAVMYEMLSGDPPFTGSTVQAIVAKVMMEKPARLVTQRDRVPAAVEGAILRALEKLPADRWASVREFAEALSGSGASVVATPSPADALRPKAKTTWQRAVGIGCIGALLGAAAAWLAFHGRSSPDSRVTTTSILPAPDGNFSEQQSLALSPDGRRLAFVFAAPDGTRSLWIRDLDKLDAKMVPQSSGADVPFWAPDNKAIGFFSAGQLRVANEAGEVRRLCPTSYATGGSWSASGLILFSDRHGISSVPAAGGTCRMIIPHDTGGVMRAVFLPDGKRILYARGNLGNHDDLTIADGDGKTLGTLPIQADVFSVVAPDRLVYASAGEAGAIDVRRVDFDAMKPLSEPRRLLNNVRARAGIHTFTVAGDVLAYLPGGEDLMYLLYGTKGLIDTIRVGGTWTVFPRPKRAGAPTIALGGNRVGLWLYDIASARASRVAISDTSVSSPRDGVGVTWPTFSPDGTHLVYDRSAPQNCSIMEHDLVRNTDRLVARTQYISMRGCPAPFDWSGDGTRLLVREDSALVIMTMDGRVESRLARPGYIWEGRFSPDGKSVAFASDETGRAEVYVQSLSGGVPARVSPAGGRWPWWTQDGRRLFFMTPRGHIDEAAMNGSVPAGSPRTVLAVPTWRRSTFDDHGAGLAVVGDGEWFVVRQSPSAVAVAYIQNWPSLPAK